MDATAIILAALTAYLVVNAYRTTKRLTELATGYQSQLERLTQELQKARQLIHVYERTISYIDRKEKGIK